MWDELERVFSVAGTYPVAQFVTNAQLASLPSAPNLISIHSIA
jgi:hypothetical protein